MAETPVRFNALAVIRAALADVGVLAAGEDVPSADGQDALRRLNRLISQLRLQEFSVPFINRSVFPITSSQNTYSVGPGGQINTQRPQDLRGLGLLLSPGTGSFAITSVSTTNRTFTVAGDQTGSLPSGSDFNVSGSTGNDGPYTILSAVYGSSTVITVSEAIPSSVVNGTIAVLADLTATTEVPVTLITDDAFQAIQVKGMSNTQFVCGYYNATYAGGLGLLWLWPTPSTAVNALVLYTDQYVEGFANLTTEYDFPPGYFDLFEYGLALRLMTPYGRSDAAVLQDLRQQFSAASTLVKRQNVRRSDLPIDAALVVGGRGSVYNILTGNG